MGVLDRIEMIKDKEKSVSPKGRQEYIYQIPLSFIPGIGQKTINRLLEYFETEMNIIHNVSYEQLEKIVGKSIAQNIENTRNGNIKIQSGGGGIYGKITT